MKIEVKDYESIVDVVTNKEDIGYTLSIVFDNGEVMVYGFPTLKDFIVNYTEFMNKYRRL